MSQHTSLRPCLEVAYIFLTYKTYEMNKRKRQYIEAACCQKIAVYFENIKMYLNQESGGKYERYESDPRAVEYFTLCVSSRMLPCTVV